MSAVSAAGSRCGSDAGAGAPHAHRSGRAEVRLRIPFPHPTPTHGIPFPRGARRPDLRAGVVCLRERTRALRARPRVRRDGARLRVSARLVGTSDGFLVWSEEYDRDLTDLFDAQQKIAAAVADALRLALAASAPPTLDDVE